MPISKPTRTGSGATKKESGPEAPQELARRLSRRLGPPSPADSLQLLLFHHPKMVQVFLLTFFTVFESKTDDLKG